MTTVENTNHVIPGSPQWSELLGRIAGGAKDRDLNDENPFDQVADLKRAGFGTLRLPSELGGLGVTVPQLFSAVLDAAEAIAVATTSGAASPDGTPDAELAQGSTGTGATFAPSRCPTRWPTRASRSARTWCTASCFGGRLLLTPCDSWRSRSAQRS